MRATIGRIAREDFAFDVSQRRFLRDENRLIER